MRRATWLLLAALAAAACTTGDPVVDDDAAVPPTSLCDVRPPGAEIAATVSTGPNETTGSSDGGSPAGSVPDDLEVVVVGDSITEENLAQIDGVLSEGGVDDVRYAALGARRIADTYDYLGPRPSGLEAVAACRADGLAPDVWLIELGTNDLPQIAVEGDPERAAGDLIDTMLVELAGAPAVVWVNVVDRGDLDVSTAFNDALDARADADPRLRVIDWYGAAAGRPDWFADDVHPNRAGAFALARLYLGELTALSAGV